MTDWQIYLCVTSVITVCMVLNVKACQMGIKGEEVTLKKVLINLLPEKWKNEKN
jgi:hypothetical protein